MKVKGSLFILFIVFFLWHRSLIAEPKILIKGLTDNKAILSVDGSLMVLKKGQIKQNMQLLFADSNKVTIKINGKEKQYFLDTSIAQTFSEPKEKIKIHQPKELYKELPYLNLKGSRVKQLTLLAETHNQVKLQVIYYYDGEKGTNADISTSVINDGRLVKNIERQFHNLEKGENQLEISLDMSKSKDIVFYSEAINFVFLSRKETTKIFYSKTIQLKKYWKKVKVR